MPNMGINKTPPAASIAQNAVMANSTMADALFTKTQQRVLFLLFGFPERVYFLNELIALAQSGSGAVQRELKRMTESGLVIKTRMGNQTHYQANTETPLFAELCQIIQKTVGLSSIIKNALMPLSDRISVAFIYGSIAKASDSASSDIDLMVISEDVKYEEIFEALEHIPIPLGRTINPTIYTRLDFMQRKNSGNAFITRILEQPLLWIIGTKEQLVPN